MGRANQSDVSVIAERRTPTQPDARHAHLSTSQRYHYAQALADALRKGYWANLQKNNLIEAPSWRALGGATPPKTDVLEALASGHERSMTRPARIYLGRRSYEMAVGSMTFEQQDALAAWMRRTYDKWGDPLTPPQLFRSSGSVVVRNSEFTGQPEQDAALHVLSFARIDVY